MAFQATIRYERRTYGNLYPSDTFSVRISSPPHAGASLYLDFKPKDMRLGHGCNLETSGIVKTTEISLSIREACIIAEGILQQLDNLGGEPLMFHFPDGEGKTSGKDHA